MAIGSWRRVALMWAGSMLWSCAGRENANANGRGSDQVWQDEVVGSSLRRLTREEYNHTVRDLLGDTTEPGQGFPAELVGDSGYATPGVPSTLDVQRYGLAADDLSLRAMNTTARWLGCDPDASSCFDLFLNAFVQRAFRRPPAVTERQALQSLYDRTTAASGARNGLRVTLSAVLQSPSFLYRRELGPDESPPSLADRRVGFSAYERAANLSYFLWATSPDDTLLQAAARGDLATADGVTAQARKMMFDPKTRDTIVSFHRQWLDLGDGSGRLKDSVKYPGYGPPLIKAMADEIGFFTTDIILHGDATFRSLLTAPYAFVNERLAALYGVTGVQGTGLRKVNVDPATRGGLLLQASVLATTANAYEGSIILRGKLLRERVLCQTIPAPPPNIPPLPPPTRGLSQRDRLQAHRQDPACAGCHQLMDPIGVGLGNYDAIGGYTEQEDGLPIVSSGVFDNLDGETRNFDGPKTLVALLAESEEARTCYAKQWYRYLFRRGERAPIDERSIAQAVTRFRASGYNIRELMIALTSSDAFLYRAPLLNPSSNLLSSLLSNLLSKRQEGQLS